MSGECDDGDTRGRMGEKGEHPISIRCKGYRGRDSRPKRHFDAASDQRGAGNKGRNLATLTTPIAYNYGNDSQGANTFTH